MQAFIFDFDGVIVDSERHWRNIDRTFFASLVPGWSEEVDGARMMGLGVKSGYALLQKEYNVQMPFDEYWAKLDAAVQNIYLNLAQMLPGLPEFLARLEAANVKIGIASSSQRPWIEATLDRLDLRKYFPVVCAANDVDERTKPLPDVYLLAAKQLGVDPRECTALEDSRNGVAAAKAAGMTCYAIRTDMNPEQKLEQADKIIKSFEEIVIE